MSTPAGGGAASGGGRVPLRQVLRGWGVVLGTARAWLSSAEDAPGQAGRVSAWGVREAGWRSLTARHRGLSLLWAASGHAPLA